MKPLVGTAHNYSREPVQHLFPWTLSWWRHYALATDLRTGSQEHTDVNKELWTGSCGSQVLKVGNGLNDHSCKHTSEPVHSYSYYIQALCSCESVRRSLCERPQGRKHTVSGESSILQEPVKNGFTNIYHCIIICNSSLLV